MQINRSELPWNNYSRRNKNRNNARFCFQKRENWYCFKSGTLTYEAADQVAKAGMGITTAIGIGGDPIIGTTTQEAVALLMNDPETDGIVMIG